MRLLLIDDSELILQKLKELLLDIKYLEIVGEALNGIDGIEMFLRHKPDIVVLDIKLPKLNGIEALQKIRKSAIPAKVIILTNYDSQYLHDSCIAEGADYFLDKSTEFQKVHDLCKEMIVNNI
jgi:DNA-binding NarL/FixJ family response regulator